MKKLIKLGLTVLFFTVTLLGQSKYLQFSGKFDRQTVRRGETVTLTLDVKINRGFHVYSVHPELSLSPTSFDWSDTLFFQTIGILQEADPELKFDENFNQTIGIHEGRFKITQQLVIAGDVSSGQHDLTGTLTYLACDATRCIPQWDDYTIGINVEDGPAREQYISAVQTVYPTGGNPDSTENGDDKSESELDEAIHQGLWSFLLLAFTMGLLVLLTPCVFPMIPITISFFTQQGEKEGSKPVKSAAVYALGIVIIYSVVGMLLSVTLGASGANMIASNPWVNLFIATLFIVFTLSLFGMFELQLPSSLRQYSLNKEQKGGMLGVLFMAFTFTLTSFTCTVQFVGLLLVAASRGAFFWPLIGMIAFSSAFALPFFFLALFPQYLSKLPKSGGWLNSVKVVMGFVIAAAAMKFFANVSMVWGWGFFDRQLVLAVWVSLAILLALYLLGKITLPHDSKLDAVSVPRFILAIMVLSFGFYLAAGLFGRPLSGMINTYLPPAAMVTDSNSGGQGNKEVSENWFNDLDLALETALKENKPVFLEFSGYTCTNCKWMDNNILSDRRVKDLLQDFILVKLYTDLGADARKNQLIQSDRYNTVALPFYAVLSQTGETIVTLPGLDRDVNNFISFLEKGKLN